MLTERSKVIGRGIAPMLCKTILGKLHIEFIHDPVPRHLGQNTGSGDTKADSIPPDKGGLGYGEILHRKAVNQGMGDWMSVFFQ